MNLKYKIKSIKHNYKSNDNNLLKSMKITNKSFNEKH